MLMRFAAVMFSARDALCFPVAPCTGLRQEVWFTIICMLTGCLRPEQKWEDTGTSTGTGFCGIIFDAAVTLVESMSVLI